MPPRSAFSQSDGSRNRRRRLLLQAAAEAEERNARRLAQAASRVAPPAPDKSVQKSESVGGAVPELVSAFISNPVLPATPAHTTGIARTEDDLGTSDVPTLRAFHPGPPELDALRKLLRESQPATWVFCGDAPADSAFPNHFATELRSTFRRSLDVVVNTLSPENTIETVLEHIDWQLARFQPDVVHVVIGSGSLGTTTSLLDALTDLINSLVDLDTIPVVHITGDSDGPGGLVEQLRAWSTESLVPLVEHPATASDHDRVQGFCDALLLEPTVTDGEDA